MASHYSLEFICDYLEAEFISASFDSSPSNPSNKCSTADINISGIADPAYAGAEDVSFVASNKYISSLKSTQACAVIVTNELVSSNPVHSLVVSNPYLAYAKLTSLFSEPKPLLLTHPSASVSDTAKIGENCSIGANVVISDNTVIGDDVVILPGVVVGPRVKLGDRTQIHPNVSIYHDVVLGEDCIIHSGTVIGCDGFGFAPSADGFIKIHQLGSVVIGDRVEIGANTSIDRGALGNTEIHDGAKIDNLVHIAHNCIIGKNTAVAGQVGMAGTTEIGENCMFGGQVGLAGHLKIADNVQVTGKSMVTKTIKEAGTYSSGTGFSDSRSWRKNVVRFNQLDEIYKRLLALEKQAKES